MKQTKVKGEFPTILLFLKRGRRKIEVSIRENTDLDEMIKTLKRAYKILKGRTK